MCGITLFSFISESSSFFCLTQLKTQAPTNPFQSGAIIARGYFYFIFGRQRTVSASGLKTAR